MKIKEKELEKIIRQAFIHGQGNKEMMESGLERDETDEYTSSVMRSLVKEHKKKRVTLPEVDPKKVKQLNEGVKRK